jgi:hypothetical protein
MSPSPDRSTPKSSAAPSAQAKAPQHQRRPQVPAIAEVGISNAGTSDQPTLEDRLGFQPYVLALAEFLTNVSTKPPIAVSIEGEWGSGKSSFMLQLADQLTRNAQGGQNTIVQFNAWRHDKVDSLWAAFAIEFARQLQRNLPWHQRVVGYLRLCCYRFNLSAGWCDLLRVSFLWLVYITCAISIAAFIFVKGPQWVLNHLDEPLGVTGNRWVQIGGLATALSVLVAAFGKVKKLVGNPFAVDLKKYIESPHYENQIDFIERFHEDLSNVIKAYGRGKVYVFVDDLDRCEIPKAADLIQGLNLMISDNPQLVFVVGMDREKVAAALATKYEKVLPYFGAVANSSSSSNKTAFDPIIGMEFGFNFIEKFIQIPFRVPQAKLEIKQFLARLTSPSAEATHQEPDRTAAEEEKIRIVTTEDSPLIREIGDVVAPALDYNPRRLKQFLNLFRLKTIIASNTGLFRGEEALTLQQLAKWVVIILRWPLLLNDLDLNPGLLGQLQKEAVKTPVKDLPQDPALDEHNPTLSRWRQRPNLLAFLRLGCVSEESGNRYDPHSDWSMEHVKVSKLLQVAPLVKAEKSRIRPPNQESQRFRDPEPDPVASTHSVSPAA